jgi:hypothetical protein
VWIAGLLFVQVACLVVAVSTTYWATELPLKYEDSTDIVGDDGSSRRRRYGLFEAQAVFDGSLFAIADAVSDIKATYRKEFSASVLQLTDLLNGYDRIRDASYFSASLSFLALFCLAVSIILLVLSLLPKFHLRTLLWQALLGFNFASGLLLFVVSVVYSGVLPREKFGLIRTSDGRPFLLDMDDVFSPSWSFWLVMISYFLTAASETLIFILFKRKQLIKAMQV